MRGYSGYFSAAGNRNNNTGAFNNQSANGNYWSSSLNSTNAYNLNFNSTNVNPANNNNRANGFTVRCLKNWFNEKAVQNYLDSFLLKWNRQNYY